MGWGESACCREEIKETPRVKGFSMLLRTADTAEYIVKLFSNPISKLQSTKLNLAQIRVGTDYSDKMASNRWAQNEVFFVYIFQKSLDENDGRKSIDQKIRSS